MSTTFIFGECQHEWVLTTGNTAADSATCRKCRHWTMDAAIIKALGGYAVEPVLTTAAKTVQAPQPQQPAPADDKRALSEISRRALTAEARVRELEEAAVQAPARLLAGMSSDFLARLDRSIKWLRDGVREPGKLIGLGDYIDLYAELTNPSPAAAVQPPVLPLTEAARDVLAERRRQVEAEGWTPEHDDEHTNGAMAYAAACYAIAGRSGSRTFGQMWAWTGWADKWFKPKDHRSNLVRAGALILAEIERLDRVRGTGSVPPSANLDSDPAQRSTQGARTEPGDAS